MILLPAIDIYEGQCVRLVQGDFNRSQQVADSWLETAISFRDAGALWIHMVDLNGALQGERRNSDIFIQTAEKTGLNVELGGGIRTMQDISFYLDRGIRRVVLGSAAVDNPSLVAAAVKKYGDKIAVGIDAMDGIVKTSGWTKKSKNGYIDTAKQMEDLGVELIIYTDINRDGTLTGPNLDHLERLMEAVSSKIIASGGIRHMEDILALNCSGVYGAICGKSIYSGNLDLKEAIAAVDP